MKLPKENGKDDVILDETGRVKLLEPSDDFVDPVAIKKNVNDYFLF